MRITEAAGTPLSMLLPSTNPWGPQDCITCNQGDEQKLDYRNEKVGNNLEKAVIEERATVAASSLQEEPQGESIVQEAEESLADMERDIKRKQEVQTGPAGRKPKKIRLERLEGWVVGTSQEEGETGLEEYQACAKEDRMAGTARLSTEYPGVDIGRWRKEGQECSRWMENRKQTNCIDKEKNEG